MSDIGVVYLCRGVDPNWPQRLTRFIASYIAHPAGTGHQLYVIYKEFGLDNLFWAKDKFLPLMAVNIFEHKDFNSYAGGSFLEAANHVAEPLVCFLGSSSEIMHDNWLAKLHAGLMLPTVGVVCCTGSYGFITEFNPQLTYPNVHIRNLSFLMDRELYKSIAVQVDWTEKPGHKLADLNFEHGPHSLTRQIMAMGKTVLVVENDRVRAPHEWGDTTYRGNLHNVLVLDRGARDYQDL
ncbi:MAG TPA: hypothetical protein VMS08_05825 [Candidatus Saccharimonadia bacterium]|nr:hypothetical protein [Candidatus Saccharimonadia bacterium]